MKAMYKSGMNEAERLMLLTLIYAGTQQAEA